LHTGCDNEYTNRNSYVKDSTMFKKYILSVVFAANCVFVERAHSAEQPLFTISKNYNNYKIKHAAAEFDLKAPNYPAITVSFFFPESLDKISYQEKFSHRDPSHKEIDDSKSFIRRQMDNQHPSLIEAMYLTTLNNVDKTLYSSLFKNANDLLFNIKSGEGIKIPIDTIQHTEQIKNQYVNIFELYKKLCNISFKLKWLVYPEGDLLPKDPPLLYEYSDTTTVFDMKEKIRKDILAKRLSDTEFFSVAIKKDNTAMNNNEIMPYIHAEKEKSVYDLELNKSTLVYLRDRPSKQIILQGTNLPVVLQNINFSKSTFEHISLENINANIVKSTNQLKITLNMYGQIESSTPFFINKTDDTICYEEFDYFFNRESYWKSDNFKGLKTQRLYQWLKQIVALWAQKNNLALSENGKAIELLKKQSFLQRWKSPQTWSYWLNEQTTWLKNNAKRLLGGAAIVGIGGLWWYAQSQKTSGTALPTTK
jgi:hypothetical protein